MDNSWKVSLRCRALAYTLIIQERASKTSSNMCNPKRMRLLLSLLVSITPLAICDVVLLLATPAHLTYSVAV